ncbi:hypothetical protein A2714_00905 [Candidatus Woesebacteria bacterium RIFCSPHIGHO2_01_FULL_38_9]|uniref:Uncharacterized protein n=2 Tax=Candidatus Woeseibacteriota TaxID=1752722 RepID=A0A1F7XZ98_9BACT|nr:MAG: hypothetical protein A2714_00905 [Candidatus Woesebacteria bacterium RIFCSPHIGHO2_01_FULL_38_9]OGM59726.1 MAG: hypothetical protein A3A75_02110 [Candidatus Woesebacteria bacterium RIFCSPLOWO2_01_FULL_39_10]
MTHVSHKKLSKQTEAEIISALKSALTNLKPNDVNKVFSALLTKTEQIMLAKRLTAAYLLLEGASYDQISKSLNLTEQTISKVHFEINSSRDVYNFLYSKLSPWKRKMVLKTLLKELGFRSLKLFVKHGGGRIY